MYKITHGRRENWSLTAETIEDARAIIRKECGGYMDAEPHYNDSDVVELWNESAEELCEVYAIERVASC